jgi:transcriptional antiterminator RfaH
MAQLLPLWLIVILYLQRGDRQVDRREWYVIYSKVRRELYAQFHLRARGLEVFFPQLLLPHALKTKNRIVALFPNYLFVRLDSFSAEYYQAIWCPGVRRIVSFNGHPTPIDKEFVQLLMRQADESGVIAAQSTLRVGQQVQISGGPFDGLVGMIQDPPNGKGRIKILLNILNRQSNVEIPVQYINAGWVASTARLSHQI